MLTKSCSFEESHGVKPKIEAVYDVIDKPIEAEEMREETARLFASCGHISEVIVVFYDKEGNKRIHRIERRNEDGTLWSAEDADFCNH
jgi:hypothetical protein